MILMPALLVLVPILISGVLLALRADAVWQWRALVAFLIADLLVASTLLVRTSRGTVLVEHVGGWASDLAIPLVVDALSALMLVLTAAMTLCVVAFAVTTKAAGQPYFGALVLVLTAGVNGALMTGDLFSLFVFIEIMLLPSYALLLLANRGEGQRMQVSATRIYVTVNLLTSVVFLMAVALIYSGFGSVNLAAMTQLKPTTTGLLGLSILLLALSIKAAVVPVHGWLGRTYPHLQPATTALFSSLHTKVAVYVIYRVVTMQLGDTRFLWIGTALFAASMVVGVLGALGQSDARAVLSFHMISQIGYILIALTLMTAAGIAAGVFYLVHNVLAKGSLFLTTGAVEHRYGRHPIGDLKGLAAREPVTATAFLVAAASLIGLPPMVGFVAKYALIRAAFEASDVLVAVLCLVVSFFTLMSMLKIWQGTFMADPEHADDDPGPAKIRLPEIAPALVLAAACLVLGLAAQPLLHLCGLIADQLLQPTAYVEAVLR